jgi:hypothetical protein
MEEVGNFFSKENVGNISYVLKSENYRSFGFDLINVGPVH